VDKTVTNTTTGAARPPPARQPGPSRDKVLIVTVQVMIVQAYQNLGSTTAAFSTATDVTAGLARLQREILRLGIEIQRLRLRDGFDAVDLRRNLLGKQLEVTLSAAPPSGGERAALERAS
jgi:hypothetical protein